MESPDGKVMLRQLLAKQDRVLDDAAWHREDQAALAELLASRLLDEQNLVSLKELLAEVCEHVSHPESDDFTQLLESLRQASKGDIAPTDTGKVGGSRAVVAESIQGDVLTGDRARSIHARKYVENIEIVHGDKHEHHHYPSQEKPIPFAIPATDPTFTGRSEELSRITTLFRSSDGTRSIGIVGMGGVGKTVLAKEVANELKKDFPAGILWLNLQDGSSESKLVAIGTWLGHGRTVQQIPDLSEKSNYVLRLLYDQTLLLIFDNAEHYEQLKCLWPDSDAATRILVTTRNHSLLRRIKCDYVQHLEPWSPDEALLYLKKQIGKPRVDNELNSATRILEYAGRLPLALSIIVGYLQDMDDMALSKYESRFSKEKARLQRLADLDDTSRNVMASLEISYERLDSFELKQLFASLSLFRGPDFGLTAVEAMHEPESDDTDMWLTRLCSLSLVEEGLGKRESLVTSNIQPKGRYRLHELVRLFAEMKLVDEFTYRKRLAGYFIDFAQKNSLPNTYINLDYDWQNILASAKWAHENGEQDLLIRGTLALTNNYLGQMGYLDVRGYWKQARELLMWAYEYAPNLPASLDKVRILTNIGGFNLRLADIVNATNFLDGALKILDTLPSSTPKLLQMLSIYDFQSQILQRNDIENAQKLLEQSINQTTHHTEEVVLHQKGYLYTQLASLLAQRGKNKEAINAADEGLALLPKKPTSARITGIINKGIAQYYLGYYQQSTETLSQGIALAQELGDVRRLASLWANIGLNERRQGDLTAALEHQAAALEIYQFTEDIHYECGININLGAIYTIRGDDQRAEQHLQRALQMAQLRKLQNVEAMTHSNLADLYLKSNRLQDAAESLEIAYNIASTISMTRLLPTVIRKQAEVTLVRNDIKHGLVLIERAIFLTELNGDIEELGVCLRVKGSLLYAQAEVEKALTTWQTSLDILNAKDPYQLAITKLILAEAVLQDSTTVISERQATTWLSEAHETFAKLRN